MKSNGKDVEDKILALMAQDLDFQRFYGGSLVDSFFSDPIRIDVFKIARLYYETYGATLRKAGIKRLLRHFKWSAKGSEHREQVRLQVVRVKNLVVDHLDGPALFQELHDNFRLRRLYHVVDAVTDYMATGDYDKAEEAFQEVTGSVSSDSFQLVDFVEHFPTRFALMEAPQEEKDAGVLLTGIKPLDKVIRFKKGNLMVFAGKTGGGKSITMQDIGMFSARKKSCTCIVTNEMTVEETAFRLDSRLTEISHDSFNKLKLGGLEKARWTALVKTIPRGTLYILEMPINCTVNRAFSVLDEHKVKPDLVLFDYANKMKPNFSIGTHWIDQGEVICDMRAVAIKRMCGVITAVQTVADSYALDRLEISDISFAKTQIAQHPDFLIGIIQTPTLKLRGKARLQIMKGRHGAKKEFIDLYPDLDIVRIHSAYQQKIIEKKRLKKVP